MLPIDKMNRIHITTHFHIASSLVLLAIFFGSFDASAQMPKPLLKLVEKCNQVQSGYVKWQYLYKTNNDTVWLEMEEAFFISTPKDLKYLLYHQSHIDSNIYYKSAHTLVYVGLRNGYTKYDDIDAKDGEKLKRPAVNGIPVNGWDAHIFQRIPPKINKKNIRYKIKYPDQEQDFLTNINREWEFDKKTSHLIQQELSLNYFKTETTYSRIDILEQHLYDYIHPDILDTISFKFDEIRKGYDKQTAEKQAKIDSAFRDSIINSVSNNISTWAEKIPQDTQKDTLHFMPEWKFPLLSGDTLYSDSIKSRFLLIDMWYIQCLPCRLAMHELASITPPYDESLLKMLSINIYDKNTAKMSQVVKNLNLKSEIACAFRSDDVFEMSKKMGYCQGYPQLYLIEMKTKQVIWHSCGFRQGFTKEIKEIITTN